MGTGLKKNDKGLYKTRETALESPLSSGMQLTADVRSISSAYRWHHALEAWPNLRARARALTFDVDLIPRGRSKSRRTSGEDFSAHVETCRSVYLVWNPLFQWVWSFVPLLWSKLQEKRGIDDAGREGWGQDSGAVHCQRAAAAASGREGWEQDLGADWHVLFGAVLTQRWGKDTGAVHCQCAAGREGWGQDSTTEWHVLFLAVWREWWERDLTGHQGCLRAAGKEILEWDRNLDRYSLQHTNHAHQWVLVVLHRMNPPWTERQVWGLC